jgi:hypothetical protein
VRKAASDRVSLSALGYFEQCRGVRGTVELTIIDRTVRVARSSVGSVATRQGLECPHRLRVFGLRVHSYEWFGVRSAAGNRAPRWRVPFYPSFKVRQETSRQVQVLRFERRKCWLRSARSGTPSSRLRLEARTAPWPFVAKPWIIHPHRLHDPVHADRQLWRA